MRSSTSRTQVSTSSSARPFDVAWQTPPVATAEPQRVGQVEDRLVRGLLLPSAVALHVQEDAARPEGFHDPRQAVGVQPPALGRPRQRLHPRQGEEPLDLSLQSLEAEPPLPFRHAGLLV